MQCHTPRGRRAVELLQSAGPPAGGTRSPAREAGPCNAVPHCHLGQWAVQLMSSIATRHRGSGQCNSCNALPYCFGAVGTATPAMHCLTAWGKWVVEFLQRSASLPSDDGQWAVERLLCSATLPRGNEQQLLQCTASLLVGNGQWSSWFASPHSPGAVGDGTCATHCLTACGQWTVQPPGMHCLTPWGSDKFKSRNALPHRLGAVGSGTPGMRWPISSGNGQVGGRWLHSGTLAIYCHTASG